MRSMPTFSVCEPLLRIVTSTVRAGHRTRPIVASTVCAGGEAGGAVVAGGGVVRGGVVVVRVGVGEGEVRVEVGVGDVPVGDPVGLVVVAPGAPDARDSPVVLIRAGMAISAPMTKNTAAMTTLGNCIASSPPPGAPGARTKRMADDPRSFLT
ncbi:hypothetical protein GCM10009678_11770 [Actinomadura kijaniata]